MITKRTSRDYAEALGSSWHEIEALPQPLRWTVQRVIFHLLDEPVPGPCGPFSPRRPAALAPADRYVLGEQRAVPATQRPAAHSYQAVVVMIRTENGRKPAR